MKRSKTAFLALVLALAACEEPTDTQRLEGVYLLDRVDGRAPPGEVCEDDAVVQVLLYESIALADSGTYGRLQIVELDESDVIQQEEFGDYVRTDSTFLLINAADDTLVLAMLDDEAVRLRRIHTCGDTLRYSQQRVEG